MERQERAGLLKSMLFQIAPEDKIENIARPVREEGRESVEDPAHKAAELGLEKIAGGRQQDLTDTEMDALEAIVLPKNRPVVFVRGDSYDSPACADPWLHAGPAQNKAQRLAPRARVSGEARFLTTL
jgi:hypothetical protein